MDWDNRQQRFPEELQALMFYGEQWIDDLPEWPQDCHQFLTAIEGIQKLLKQVKQLAHCIAVGVPAQYILV